MWLDVQPAILVITQLCNGFQSVTNLFFSSIKVLYEFFKWINNTTFSPISPWSLSLTNYSSHMNNQCLIMFNLQNNLCSLYNINLGLLASDFLNIHCRGILVMLVFFSCFTFSKINYSYCKATSITNSPKPQQFTNTTVVYIASQSALQ